MIKVGFVFNFSKTSWLGGYNYYKNFFYLIDKYKSVIQPVIITQNSKNFRKDDFFKKYEIYETSLINKNKILLRFFQKLCLILFGNNFLMTSFLKKNSINVLSHDVPLGAFSKIPSFPWFPDFQEIHLPQNFSLIDKFFRRLNIILASIHSTNIILSSYSAQKDLKKISNKAYYRSFVIRHEDILSSKIKQLSKEKTKIKFNLKGKYFIVCDQFWKHKNHIIILKALDYLKRKKIEYRVISTGLMYDWRHPGYISLIKKFIKKKKLEKNFKILGIVSDSELISLIKHSICLLKPSKSEGLSNSVEQAKNLGTRVIMSDILVHKEQKNKNCYIFRPNDYKKLGKLMIKVLKGPIKINNQKKKLKHDFIKNYIKLIEKKHYNF